MAAFSLTVVVLRMGAVHIITARPGMPRIFNEDFAHPGPAAVFCFNAAPFAADGELSLTRIVYAAVIHLEGGGGEPIACDCSAGVDDQILSVQIKGEGFPIDHNWLLVPDVGCQHDGFVVHRGRKCKRKGTFQAGIRHPGDGAGIG